MEIILDGNIILNKELLFDIFKDYFSDLYGNNLDALWDVLSYYSESIVIKIVNYDKLKMHLSDYLDKLVQLLDDLKKEKSNFDYDISY